MTTKSKKRKMKMEDFFILRKRGERDRERESKRKGKVESKSFPKNDEFMRLISRKQPHVLLHWEHTIIFLFIPSFSFSGEKCRKWASFVCFLVFWVKAGQTRPKPFLQAFQSPKPSRNSQTVKNKEKKKSSLLFIFD